MADDHMSDLEAMMWNVERDPWLDPNGGSVAVYDQPLDIDLFRLGVRRAVAELPRLRQRVAPGLAPLSTPRWVTDQEFDLDWHVRRVGAPGDGTLRDVLDFFGPWLQDPYDQTRPLWMYVVVDGMADGRGALLAKFHHTLGDGETLVRMTLAYTSTERHPEPQPEVDLERIIAEDPDEDVGIVASARDAVGQGLKRQADLGRRALRNITRPRSVARTGSDVADLVKTASEQRQPAGSDLWRTRSRRRRVDAFSLPFEDVRSAARALGGTVNDLFLTGVVEAGVRYHQAFDESPRHFHLTIVVNTRAGDDETANAFSPIPIDVSAAPMTLADRFAGIHDLVRSKREEVHGSGPMAAMASVANLLPVPLMTSVARDQAGHIDFATSNLPGYPVETFVAGARTMHCYPFGPVAGTAFNLTAISTHDMFDLGLHVDPAAVTDPEALTAHLRATYEELLAHA